jgi:hypothetical protein
MGGNSGSLLDIVSLKFFSLVSYSFHLLCRDWWNKKLLKQRQLDNRNIFHTLDKLLIEKK